MSEVQSPTLQPSNAASASPPGEVQSGLEGVVAFATEIAEPDKAGGALRYRGVDIESLVGAVPFEHVWGLLVDDRFRPGLPPAEPHVLTVRSGDHRVDVQSALAMLAPEWGFGQLIDISDDEARDNLARASVMALSFVAQSARGSGQPPVPQETVDRGRTIPERFLIRWRGEADPAHVKAIDAYWISAAEHGMNASTFTARVVASTASDPVSAVVAAIGALKGPLHGGAPGPVLAMLDAIGAPERAASWIAAELAAGRRIMGMGHRVYRVRDPRAAVLERAVERLRAAGLRSDRLDLARAVEAVAVASLGERRPERRLAANVEFYTAVILDAIGLPQELFSPTFAVARVAGWLAHIDEQARAGRLIRPSSRYVGPMPETPAAA